MLIRCLTLSFLFFALCSLTFWLNNTRNCNLWLHNVLMHWDMQNHGSQHKDGVTERYYHISDFKITPLLHWWLMASEKTERIASYHREDRLPWPNPTFLLLSWLALGTKPILLGFIWCRFVEIHASLTALTLHRTKWYLTGPSTFKCNVKVSWSIILITWVHKVRLTLKTPNAFSFSS